MLLDCCAVFVLDLMLARVKMFVPKLQSSSHQIYRGQLHWSFGVPAVEVIYIYLDSSRYHHGPSAPSCLSIATLFPLCRSRSVNHPTT